MSMSGHRWEARPAAAMNKGRQGLSGSEGLAALGKSFDSVPRFDHGSSTARPSHPHGSISMQLQNNGRHFADHLQMKAALPASNERDVASNTALFSVSQRPTMARTYMPADKAQTKKRTSVIMAAVKEGTTLDFEVADHAKD